MDLYFTACTSVCVCERERERERVGEGGEMVGR